MKQELALLHCISSYPAPLESANLLAIRVLEQFGDVVGYSDHTIGVEAAAISVAVGSRIIEKHFTIDNHFSDFQDHQLSANPKDFKKMVLKIRNIEKILGQNIKEPSVQEIENLEKNRRSIVAKHDLMSGHILTINDLDWVRPGIGMKPGQESYLIGKKLKNISKNIHKRISSFW